jgi:hypothetical protein
MTELDHSRDGTPQGPWERIGGAATARAGRRAMPDQDGAGRRERGTGSRARGFWATARAALGALLGLVPHVMHHVGILAGAALVAGGWGNSLLYVAGLLLSIPLLNRLRKRFGTWKAPAVGAAVFTAMFLVSALVIGPAISRSGVPGASPASVAPSVAADHASHHGG